MSLIEIEDALDEEVSSSESESEFLEELAESSSSDSETESIADNTLTLTVDESPRRLFYSRNLRYEFTNKHVLITPKSHNCR